MRTFNKKKIFAVIFGLLIFALLLIVVFQGRDNEVDQEQLLKRLSDPEQVEWTTYTSATFGFSIDHPSHWEVYEQLENAPPTVSFYPVEKGADPPFLHTDNVTHVSVYPQGVGSGGIFERERAGTVVLSERAEQNTDYVMKDGKTWASFITFADAPEPWKSWGFLWAGVEIEGLSFSCDRGGTEVDFDNCDPVFGDIILRSGAIDSETRETQEQILESFKFVN